MSGRVIWKNGKFLDESEAHLSVYDSALMWGDMVFEMMRTFHGHTFRLWEHLDRLWSSMKYCEIEIPYSQENLKDAIYEVTVNNKWDSGDEIRMLINVSRGILPIYEKIAPLGTQVIITAFPLRWVLNGMSKYFRSGIHGITTSQRQAKEIEPKVKGRSRLHYKMADLEAKRQDASAFPILLDADGFISESSGSNIFFVKDGEIITPEGRNCLRGISRGFVIELCKQNNIRCIERNIDLYDAITAEEAFFTATPWCIMPCTKINFRSISDGKVGKITQHLTELWSKYVGLDFVSQAEEWDAN